MPSSPFSTFSSRIGDGSVALESPLKTRARHRRRDVQADHVLDLHRAEAGEAEAGAGLDGHVQVLRRDDALVEEVVDLTLERPHEAIDDEAGPFDAYQYRVLARSLEKPLGLGVRGVGAVRAAVDLDERDDVRGVEVVDADDRVGARQPLGERVHDEAAGVAADDHVRGGRLQTRQDVPLLLQHLLHGLYHVGAALDRLRHVGGHHALDAARHLVDGLADQAELDELRDVLPDLAECPHERLVTTRDEPHVEPVLREGLCDALAHGAGTYDQDSL